MLRGRKDPPGGEYNKQLPVVILHPTPLLLALARLKLDPNYMIPWGVLSARFSVSCLPQFLGIFLSPFYFNTSLFLLKLDPTGGVGTAACRRRGEGPKRIVCCRCCSGRERIRRCSLGGDREGEKEGRVYI